MLRFTLAVLVAIPLASAAGAAEPFRLRVLSYNIHHGEGVDGRLDIERIAGVIESVSPSVVALQEVDRETKRVERMHQPHELARLTGMRVIFEQNLEFQGGAYGNAILSSTPVDTYENVHLPRINGGEQRGVLVCKITPRVLGMPILLLCTHLDHRPNDRERLAAVEKIEQIVAQHPDVPALLLGDLNATPESAVLKRLSQTWKIANARQLATHPAPAPTRQIDYILAHPAERWRTIDVRVIEEAVASDHRPIFAILELLPEPPQPESSR